MRTQASRKRQSTKASAKEPAKPGQGQPAPAEITRLGDVGSVAKLPIPERGNKVYYDDGVPGFGVRVTAAGHRSFVLNYRTQAGRERRITIGAVGDWTISPAREKARQYRRQIDDGGDPLADIEAEREAPTVAQLCDRFEDEYLPDKRGSTAADYKRIIAKHVRPHFGPHVKVADVRFEDISALHSKITKTGAAYAANRCVALLSKMFSLAIRWNMRKDNPCKGIERNTEYQRRRYLKAHELSALTAALAADPDQKAANVFRLLLLTGARRGEVLSMRWADVDLGDGKWSKPASSTKQKEDHEVPLSAPARQLLAEIREQQTGKRGVLGEYVFPGNGDSKHVVEIKRAWARLCKAAGISGVRIHDLRHSFASLLVSGGASLPLIGALLGHSNPSTTARYAHLLNDPLVAAVEKIGAIIGAAGKSPTEPTPGPGLINKRRGA